MVDGIGGTDLMTAIFDLSSDAARVLPVSWAPEPGPSVLSLVTSGARDTVTWPIRQLAGAPGFVRGRLRSRADLVRFSRGLGGSARRLAVPSASSLNGPIGPHRRWVWTTASLNRVKRTRQAVGAEFLTEMLGFAAPTLLALGPRAAFQLPQPLVQTVTTNVPGPRFPLFVLGRKMVEAYPYVPIGDNVRISVAIFSCLDRLSFGITADYSAAPDLDVLTKGIRRGLAELQARPVPARRAAAPAGAKRRAAGPAGARRRAATAPARTPRPARAAGSGSGHGS